MIVISACLVGENCKYNGGNNEALWVLDILKKHNCITVCPERAGGLPTPRLPSEIREDRIVNNEGKDVTSEFLQGAKIEYDKIEKVSAEYKEHIEFAILKSRSPSCGYAKIYDGTFSNTLINGNGIFAEMLLNKNIEIFTEDRENQEKLNEKL